MAVEWKTGYKQKQVRVTLTDAEVERLGKLARKRGLALAELIREMAGLPALPKGRRPKQT